MYDLLNRTVTAPKKHSKNKLRWKKNTIFLGLMKFNLRQYRKTISAPRVRIKKNFLVKETFICYYTPLVSLFYIFNTLNAWTTLAGIQTSQQSRTYLSYYTTLSRTTTLFRNKGLPKLYFNALSMHNFVLFSKPKKQIFITFFCKKPVFIFTGGLMRLVTNEQKKSHKKLYKVAISIFRLAQVLLRKNVFFNECFIRLVNIGPIRRQLLKTLKQNNVWFKIYYVILSFRLDWRAQKFKTRRSIKKYVRKRFKVT